MARATLPLLLIACAIAHGCGRKPVEKRTLQTFEQGDEGWVPFGTDARIEVVHDASLAKSGSSALAVRYEVKPGQYGSAVLPLEAGELSGLRQLQFWIKAERSTPVIVVLSEKQPGGGYYSSWFWCPKSQWVRIGLTPQDFVVNQGPSDPIDRNGGLDLDQVSGIGITDLGQFFQTLGSDPAYPLVVDKTIGTQTLFLDDVEFVTSTQGAHAGLQTDKQIGHPERGFVTWIALGGTELSVADAGSPLGEPGFAATYEQRFGRYVAISHSLLDHDLGGTETLNAVIASKNDSNVMVYLEEKNPGAAFGPRYSHQLSVPGGSRRTAIGLQLSAFQPDATGMTDPNGKLDAARLKSISVVDITAADQRPPKPNTLWVSRVTAH